MTKYIHIRGEGPKGGVTVAFTAATVGNVEGDAEVVLSLGLAFCSPLDRYHKAKGRGIALTRLRTRPIQIVYEGMAAVESRLKNDLIFLLDHLTWPASLEWTASHSAVAQGCSRWSTRLLLSDFKNSKVSIDSRTPSISDKERGRGQRHLGWVSSIPRWAPGFVREAYSNWKPKNAGVVGADADCH